MNDNAIPQLDVEKLVFEFGRNLQGVLAGGSEPRLLIERAPKISR
jgi:hypothetical protein